MRMTRSTIAAAVLLISLAMTHRAPAEGPALVTAEDPSLGPADAPVTLVMFCDFECPHCGRSREAVTAVAQRRRDVRVVYRDFPIVRAHPQAGLAAEAAACAQDQGRYWQMWERLFDNQGHLDPSSLRRYAQAIGLNGTAFDECLASGRHRAGWLADRRDGEALGVVGTPTFFLNGRRLEGELTAAGLEAQIARLSR
jgi:protein-disulfide isomerase